MWHLREMWMNGTVLSPTELMLVANVTASNRCGQLSETAALKNFSLEGKFIWRGVL